MPMKKACQENVINLFPERLKAERESDEERRHDNQNKWEKITSYQYKPEKHFELSRKLLRKSRRDLCKTG